AGLQPVARDVHPVAVDQHVVVTHELTRLSARDGEASAVHGVVQAALEQPQHLFAGSTREARGLRVVEPELVLEQAVDATRLLCLAQAQAVLTHLEAALAVLTGRVRATGDRALFAVAALALQIELRAFAAAQLANGA